jgi:hypothetical protein
MNVIDSFQYYALHLNESTLGLIKSSPHICTAFTSTHLGAATPQATALVLLRQGMHLAGRRPVAGRHEIVRTTTKRGMKPQPSSSSSSSSSSASTSSMSGPERAPRPRLPQPAASSSSSSRSSKGACERSGQNKLQRGNNRMDAKRPSSRTVPTRKDSQGGIVSKQATGTFSASSPQEPRCGGGTHHRDVVFEPSPRELKQQQQQQQSLSSSSAAASCSLLAPPLSQLSLPTTAHVSPLPTDDSRLKKLRQRRVAQECVLRGQFQNLSRTNATTANRVPCDNVTCAAMTQSSGGHDKSHRTPLPPPPLLSPQSSRYTHTMTNTATVSDESSAAAVNAYDSTLPDDASTPLTLPNHLDCSERRLSGRSGAPSTTTQESHKDALSHWRCENAQLRRQLQVAHERLGQTQQQLDCLHQCLQQSYTGITHAIGHNSLTVPTTTTTHSNRTLDMHSSWHEDSAGMLRSASMESLLSHPHMTRCDKETSHSMGSHNKDNVSTFSTNSTIPLENSSALAERLRTAHATILNLEIEKAGLIELLARAYVSMPLLESQQQQPTKRQNLWTLSPPPSPTESMTETDCTLDSANDFGSSSSTASEQPLAQAQAHATIATLRQEVHRRAQAAVLSEQRLRSLELQLTQAHVQLHRQRQESLDTVRGYAQFLEDAVQAVKASQAETQRLQQALHHRETTATTTTTTAMEIATGQPTTNVADGCGLTAFRDRPDANPTVGHPMVSTDFHNKWKNKTIQK